MKFFLAIALLVAVASAGVIKPHVTELQLEEIIAAIQSPSVDSATAAMLLDQLNQALGIMPSPAIIEPVIDPVQVVDESENLVPVIPGPAVIPTPVAEETSGPLVQIIVNVKGSAAGGVNPVQVVGPTPAEAIVDPVQVVDEAAEIVSPIVPAPIVLPPIIPAPIVLPPPVLPPVVPEPIILPPAVLPPVKPEPVIVVPQPETPIIPQPVVLPETLN